MLTGELRSKIDGVWNAFWAGGIANPLEVIEQITYLLFMRGLDEAHTREENKANRLGKPIERRIFPKGKDKIGKDGGIPYEDMRWSRLKNRDPATMFEIVSEHVFPFLRSMADANTAHATHMKGARFTIPTPALLAKVVDLLADIPMEDRDTKGDLYEYMLAKIATAGQNGQFRTPPSHHRADGRDDGARAEGRDLRSRLRHVRLPCRCRRISARESSEAFSGKGVARSFP
jgi:type I restriction enzyme M protein